jgi:hypothetical protein
MNGDERETSDRDFRGNQQKERKQLGGYGSGERIKTATNDSGFTE